MLQYFDVHLFRPHGIILMLPVDKEGEMFLWRWGSSMILEVITFY